MHGLEVVGHLLIVLAGNGRWLCFFNFYSLFFFFFSSLDAPYSNNFLISSQHPFTLHANGIFILCNFSDIALEVK